MSGYPYPPDEFDIELDDSHALGIHHTRPSTWRKVWPFLAVVVVCALLAALAVTWFTQQGGRGSTAATTPPPAVATTDTPTTDAPTTSGPTDDESDEPTTPEETTPDEEPTTSEPEEPTVELDRGVAIRVLNATSRQGLAAGRLATLSSAGWTNAVADNFSGTAPSRTTVWFASDELEDEALRVGADLGIDTVVLVPEMRGEIAVILLD